MKYTTVFLSINNETQCVSLFSLLSRFIEYAPSFKIKIILNLDIA